MTTSATTPDAKADVIVYAVVDDALSLEFPLGDALDVFIRREDAERFIAEVRGDDPGFGSYLRIEGNANSAEHPSPS